MKLLVLFFFFYIASAYSQQTIDKLNSNQLKLPKESVSKALILDATGQVKSSSTITDTELSYLDGLTNTITSLLSGKANDTDVVKLTTDQSISGTKTFTGKIVASSTVNGSVPCPVMTETQRNAFTAALGDCVFNSTSLKLTIYDGAVWKDAGGAGGVSLWLTANPYIINDVVIESDRIYRCLVAHTSGTFATDLAASRWVEVSASPSTPYSLANGGTNKALTASNGGVVWVDADSFEILSAGTSGQILQSNAAAAPSWVNKSVSGKADNSTAITLEEIQVANNQLTQTAANKHKLETGNSNILVNPSFEHSTFSTGWTNSAGTFTEETVLEIDGLKAAKLVLSAQAMSLTQSSTLYASQFADGVQGLAMVRVKSTVALKVCAIQAGVVSTSLCVDVPATNKWGPNPYKIPFTLGATSNGISIASTGNVTGTVYVDEAFLGAVDLSATQSFDTTCDTIACETDFSVRVSSTGVVSNESQDFINSNCTVASAIYTCTFNASTFTVAPNCTLTAADNAGTFGVRFNSQGNTNVVYATLNTGSGVGTAFNVNMKCQKQGADYTSAMTSRKAFQKSKVSSYSSTNADTDWASCGLTGSALTGFGTAVPTPELQCKRDGGDLLMKGKFTAGTTPTAVEARLSLPVWNGVQLVSAGSSVIPSLQVAGDALYSGASTTYFRHATLIEPSVSYITFGRQDSTATAINKGLGNVIASTATSFSITARTPIEGWQNSKIIIGQFNGLESCTDTYECTDTFSAKISAAGVVSDENIDWINGNASITNTSTYALTFKSSIFSVTPTCLATFALGVDASAITPFIRASSLTAVSIRTTAAATAAATASDFTIICQKQGADYIGKTAKAVASDQNVRSIGSIGMDLQSVYFGSSANCATACTTGNCTICKQVGNKITSVTFQSTGIYRFNGIDGTKYSCQASGIAGGNYAVMYQNATAQASSYVQLNFASVAGSPGNAEQASVTCIGIP